MRCAMALRFGACGWTGDAVSRTGIPGRTRDENRDVLSSGVILYLRRKSSTRRSSVVPRGHFLSFPVQVAIPLSGILRCPVLRTIDRILSM